MIKNVKNTFPWSYVIEDFNKEEIFWAYYEWELQKKKIKIQAQLRVRKVIKRKGDKLNIQWKGYYNSFNCCKNKIDMRQMS